MKTPWTVLYVDHTGRLGGGERSLLDLLAGLDRDLIRPVVALGEDGPFAEALDRLGLEPRLLDLDPALGRASRRRPLEILAALGRPGAFGEAVEAVRRLARAEGARLVHTNSQKAHWIALAAARRLGLPIVWHFRDILEPGPLRAASSAGARLATRTLCISAAVRRSLGARHDGRRLRVVHNGIADPGPRPPRPRGGPLVVGMVSQLARWKGPEVFLEAAALAARERADLEFRIVGEVLFPESEGADYAARLAARAGDLGLASRVRFTGPVPDARAWTGELDVLVHPAIRPEPFGRVLVEAMAAGIPVVATRSGAAEEIVAGGRTGILVPPGDARAIAGAVLDLAADPARAAALGARGRERALAAFGIERTIGRVVSIYREILE